MTDVFINYRGADSNYAARLLYEGLKPRFGRQVFFDEETIQPGEDYVLRLLRGVRESKVLLAVIGPHWLAKDSHGNRRIDDERDWIRRELLTAKDCDVLVFPVFTEGARPEDLDELPDELRWLRTAQGMNLRLRRADDDIAQISDEVARHVPARHRRRVLVAAALAALLLVSAGVGLSFAFRGSTPSDTAGPTPTTTTPTTTATESSKTTAPRTTTAAVEPGVFYAGTLNLDVDTFTTGYFLDWSPPERAPLGDLGLCLGFDCGGPSVGGVAFVPWDSAGLPERQRCVELLNTVQGIRRLPVKAGTTACLATEGKRIGRLEVVKVDGPSRMTIDVTIWDRP